MRRPARPQHVKIGGGQRKALGDENGIQRAKGEAKSMSEKLKVKTYCINRGTSSQYYGLKNAKENTVLQYAPNNWKTERGAYGWAKKNGYEVPKSALKTLKATKPKTKAAKKKK